LILDNTIDPSPTFTGTPNIDQIANDGGRSLMGSRQENWMYRTLSESAKRGATWRVVGSQIVFSHISRAALDQSGNGLNLDAWDGYQSNKNRTLHHLYSNNINNNIFLAGDSHASWVSDLVWLDEKEYDTVTGAGSIGVEFAGSAISSPCPYGENITLATANNYSSIIEGSNVELHWQDLYYRGYYELHFTKDKVDANFFGIPTIREKKGWEIPIANFTVENGANKLQRPVGGGVVGSGSLKFGKMVQNNLTVDTSDGKWFKY
jgi:alkaline phosphatase D